MKYSPGQCVGYFKMTCTVGVPRKVPQLMGQIENINKIVDKKTELW